MKDITGQKFNRLTALEFVYRDGTKYYWLFKCDCGTEKMLLRRSVAAPSGDVKSCGCLFKEKLPELTANLVAATRKHGLSDSRFYRTWRSIQNRCYNFKQENFPRYGGKGVACNWKTFEQFMQDMYTSYQEHVLLFGEKQTTIDRIDGNKDYSKDNCRWATYLEQRHNRVTYG